MMGDRVITLLLCLCGSDYQVIRIQDMDSSIDLPVQLMYKLPASLIRFNPDNEFNESFLSSLLEYVATRQNRKVSCENTKWYNACCGS